MLELLAKLLKLLNSETDPGQISLGMAFGMVLGLLPFWNLTALTVLLLICLLRVNFSMTLLSYGLFSGLAYLITGLAIELGAYLLTLPSLQSLWTQAYQNDLLRLTHFNHDLTLGMLIIALALFLPTYWLGRLLIVRYRLHILAWVNKISLVRVIKASRFYQLYLSLGGDLPGSGGRL